MTIRYAWLLAVVLFASGCGKAERAEAVRLSKVLTQKQGDFAGANTMEEEFVNGARVWCEGIVTNGAGRGEELNRNASVATVLAKSAADVSTQLGQVRQAVYDQSFQAEYPQSVRTGLISQLTQRQRVLQQLRAFLQQSAKELEQYQQNKSYAGDTYPGVIQQLGALLNAYKAPDDAVGAALAALKTKYRLTGSEP
ncbi:MAG TPA: hypothetical protein VFA33_03930 [Bryobacteraceae bacterium]|nr:hypothetical protein [Bryobacteraceae bacterium]